MCKLLRFFKEVFVDYYALDPHLFSMNVVNSIGLRKPQHNWKLAYKMLLERMEDCLVSVLFSLKKFP